MPRPWWRCPRRSERCGPAVGSGSASGFVAEPSPAPIGFKTTPIGRGLRLLLAEDHALNREIIGMQLSRLGFDCDFAEDGEAAWQLLASPAARYAVLLTDCRMPRLDGFGLAMRLRAHEAQRGLPRLPVIALTADSLAGEARRCQDAGIDAWLAKPLQARAFEEALAGLLQPRSPAPAMLTTGHPAPVASYPALIRLCGGDPAKATGLLRVFVEVTRTDLKALDEAMAERDCPRLQQLAHRLASACQQLDEQPAVSALRMMECLIDADDLGLEDAVRDRYPLLRNLLAAVLARAADFVRRHGGAG